MCYKCYVYSQEVKKRIKLLEYQFKSQSYIWLQMEQMNYSSWQIYVMRNVYNLMISQKTIRSLVNQVSFHWDSLPWSFKDISQFTRELLTILIHYGSAKFFATFPSDDSIWVEPSIDISYGLLDKESAINYTMTERANLLRSGLLYAMLLFNRILNA